MLPVIGSMRIRFSSSWTCNAFNSVDREHVLRETRAHLPDWPAGPAGVMAYSKVTLFPVLFALAPTRLAAALHSGGLDLCFAYLDDVVLAGTSRQVTEVLGQPSCSG